MKKENIRNFIVSAGLFVLFVVWTILVMTIDVKAIGPRDSAVGFATINGFFHRLTGVHFTLYNITDWLGLVPVAICFGFAILGLVQWIKRKKLCKVDYSLFVLGGFYILVMGAYILFEIVVVNRRPVVIAGYLEVSYPSSTTLLVMTVMPTALMQLRERIKRRVLNTCVSVVIVLFTIFMVVGRLISGVHWLSDIVGGALLSAGLVMLYYSAVKLKSKDKR